MRILVVDDEEVQLESIRRGLRIFGFDAHCARTITDAKVACSDPELEFALVITDLTMPGGSGRELIEWLRDRELDSPVIVITGLRSSADEGEVKALGVPILRKPFSPSQLGELIWSETSKSDLDAPRGRSDATSPQMS